MSPPGTGLVRVVRTLLLEGGVRGLYRGFAPPLLLTGTINTLLWGSTFAVVDALASRGWGDPVSRALVAAVPASFATSLIVAPMELLKTRQQTAPRTGSRGPPLADVLRGVLHERGVRGLFRGWTPVLGARLSGGWFYFGGNVFALQQLAVGLPPGESALARTRNVLLAGGMAGVMFWCPAMPFDTVKTRLMAVDSPFVGPLQCARALYAEGGVRGFYRGFSAALVRAFPANAAAFTAFDITMRGLTARSAGAGTAP